MKHMNNQNALQVEGLTKRYRHTLALDNLSFRIRPKGRGHI